LRPHGCPFEKIEFEIEAFALEIYLDDDISTENFSMICYESNESFYYETLYFGHFFGKSDIDKVF
jgi:hypothetical protein